MAVITVGSTAEAASRSVFLAPVTVIGVDEALGVTVLAEAAAFLGGQSEYVVVTSEEVRAILEHEKTKTMVGCDEDAACLAKVSAATNADLLIATTVGRVGKSLVLSMSLVDPEQGTPLARVSETVGGAEALPEAVRVVLAGLLGVEGGQKKEVYVLPTGKKLSFAVLDLQPTGVDKEVAGNLTQLLSAEIKKVEGASVIGRDDLVAILSLDKLDQMLGEECDTSCVAELGGALGVDKLISGSVGKLGESYFISLRMLDPATVKIDNRVTESFKGTEEQLIRAINHTARKLLGLGVQKRGALIVTASQEAADVYVNNEKVGTLPLPPIANLDVGRHSIRLVRDGFFDWQQDAYVDPGDTTALWAELQERPERWYQKWWVWAGAGTVVVGSVTAILIASIQSPDSGRVDIGITGGELRVR